MITWDNYEEYMLMHADGELSPAEVKELMAFVRRHPGLEKEIAAFSLTKLAPDAAQLYAGKEALLKAVPARKIALTAPWKHYAVAAGIAALLFTGLYRYIAQGSDTGRDIATHSRPDSSKPHTDTTYTATGIAAQDSTPAAPLQEQQTQRQEDNIQQVAHTTTHNDSSKPQPAVQEDKQAHHPAGEPIAGITPYGIKELPQVAAEPTTQLPNPVPEYAAEEKPDEKKSLWDRLPIDDIKKRNLEKLAGAVADAFSEASAAKQELADKSVSVKVKKRKLIISF